MTMGGRAGSAWFDFEHDSGSLGVLISAALFVVFDALGLGN